MCPGICSSRGHQQCPLENDPYSNTNVNPLGLYAGDLDIDLTELFVTSIKIVYATNYVHFWTYVDSIHSPGSELVLT